MMAGMWSDPFLWVSLALLVVVIVQGAQHSRDFRRLNEVHVAVQTEAWNQLGKTARLLKAGTVKEAIEATAIERHAEDEPVLSGGLTDQEEAELEEQRLRETPPDPNFDGPVPRKFRHERFLHDFNVRPTVNGVPLETDV